MIQVVTKTEFNQWVDEVEHRLFLTELMDAVETVFTHGTDAEGKIPRLTNFAGDSAQLNKTTGNGDKQATRKPDLDSAAVNERKRND